jgi:hypothetical protein
VVSVTPRPRSISGERTLVTHYTGGWVGPRACLDTDIRGKILYLCRESNLDSPIVQSVARHYTDWATRFPYIVRKTRKSSITMDGFVCRIERRSSRMNNIASNHSTVPFGFHGGDSPLREALKYCFTNLRRYILEGCGWGFRPQICRFARPRYPIIPLDPILIIDANITGWVAYMNSCSRSEIVLRLVTRQRGDLKYAWKIGAYTLEMQLHFASQLLLTCFF